MIDMTSLAFCVSYIKLKIFTMLIANCYFWINVPDRFARLHRDQTCKLVTISSAQLDFH